MKSSVLIITTALVFLLVGCGGGSGGESSSSSSSTTDASLIDIKTITHGQSYAKFYKPEDIVLNDGYAYISDTANNCIRRIAPNGTVITVIGSVTGIGGDNTDTSKKGTSALMSGPTSLTIATINGRTHLFIADTGNNKILDADITGNPLGTAINVQKIAGNKSSGYVDANGSNALFFQPHGLHVVANILYVADTMNHAIRDINLTNGSYPVSTLTDSMEATSQPIDLTDDGNGNLLVLLKGANRVDSISISTPDVGVLSPIVGLNAPEALTRDGDTLYISNTQDHMVLDYNITLFSTQIDATLTPTTMDVYHTISAGVRHQKGNFEGTTLRSALFDEPVGLYSTPNELYIVDRGNHKIRKILKTERLVRTVMGSGEAGLDAVSDDTKQKIEEFYKPEGLVIDPEGKLYVCDTQNQKIRRIDLGSTSKSIISTYIGQQTVGITAGNTVGTLASTRLYNPTSIVGLWDANQTFYIVDSYNNNIKKTMGINTTFFAGSSTKLSGYLDGNTTSALFNRPYAAVADTSGNLYVTDSYNHRIRKITPLGVVTTLAGGTEGFVDGQGTNAKFSYPTGIAFDGSNTLYILDNGNKKIRTMSLSGNVNRLDISGVSFNNIYGVTINPQKNTLFVSDTSSNQLWSINISTKKATSLIAETTTQWVDGNNSNSPFSNVRINHPKGLFYDKNSDKIYISDTDNNIIRVMRVAY